MANHSNWPRTCASGVPFATPVFDGAKESEIRPCSSWLACPSGGQVNLSTVVPASQFERQVTVGYMHVLKLHHLVDDKMHARSTGRTPSSPSSRWAVRRSSVASVSGKWKSGRWKPTVPAYTLQEMLTVKSDDVTGRTKVYENIVKGEHKIDAGMPESFNVLVKEIRSLAIDIDLDRY